MLPLSDVPPGWTLGKLGELHLETFNAENLFEKIDGRAESFLDYDVRGMAYADFHPNGDESADVQVYIFEMGNSLKALGKFGSEKPEEVSTLAIGSDGYSSAGSVIFYAGPYYTQVVTTTDDAKFAAFAKTMAERIVAKQVQRPAPAPSVAALAPAVSPPDSPTSKGPDQEKSAATKSAPVPAQISAPAQTQPQAMTP